MKKFLEVLVDDDGAMHFSTDVSLDSDLKDMMNHPEKMEKLVRRGTKGIVDNCWKDKDPRVNSAIRILSICEMMSCAEPYEQVEDFWFSMMHEVIPFFEAYSDKLKRPYGYDPSKKMRPKVFNPAGMFFPDNFRPKS